MSGYLDLHCHILPHVDDGPDSLETSVELVRGMEEIGFGELVPTPHQKPGSWTPSPQENQAQAEDLREALAAAGSPVKIHPPGGELMWSDRFLEAEPGDLISYPGGAAVLVEFVPLALPSQLRERFFELRVAGLLPVLAHVERYPGLADNLQRMEALAQNAALTVNLSSLGGWWSSRTPRRLVQQGMIHAVASDCHGPGDVEPCRKGIAWLERALGGAAVRQLLVDNPHQILQGELPGR